jgi:hypothetical protein
MDHPRKYKTKGSWQEAKLEEKAEVLNNLNQIKFLAKRLQTTVASTPMDRNRFRELGLMIKDLADKSLETLHRSE